jgi:transposase
VAHIARHRRIAVHETPGHADAEASGEGRRAQERISRFAAMRRLVMQFRGVVKSKRADKLDKWLEDATASGIYAMRRFVRTLRQDIDAVRNAITDPWSNGQTEGQINRLKTLKRSMYGRAGLELLRARMLPIQRMREHRV